MCVNSLLTLLSFCCARCFRYSYICTSTAIDFHLVVSMFATSKYCVTVIAYIIIDRGSRKKMRPAHQVRDGKRSELIAASWLMSQNCYVYTPFIEQGPIDLIALTPKGELLLFDVKTVGRRKNGSIISRLLTDTQKKLGVRLLYVDLETGSCALYPYQLSRSPQNHGGNMQNNRHLIGTSTGVKFQPLTGFFTQRLR